MSRLPWLIVTVGPLLFFAFCVRPRASQHVRSANVGRTSHRYAVAYYRIIEDCTLVSIGSKVEATDDM